MSIRQTPFFLLFFLLTNFLSAQQDTTSIPFLQPADTLHRGRFWTSVGIGTTVYGGMTYGLSQAWYSESEQGRFHLFNDWGEWEHVDKAGHFLTAYNYSQVLYTGARWTGMKRKKALWTAASVSFVLQGTIEVLDGFSEKWGFSLSDIGFNTLGVGLFVGQELAWREQRITMKISSSVPTYPNNALTSIDGMHTTTLDQRAAELFGTSPFEKFFKDYNAQTNWLSFNIHSFTKKENKIPKWLNIAVGYGAQNMYEGFGYDWTEEKTGISYERNPDDFPRYGQIYLSFDVDMNRIPTKNRFLKTAFSILNFIKIPSPSVEFTTHGKVKFHPIYY